VGNENGRRTVSASSLRVRAIYFLSRFKRKLIVCEEEERKCKEENREKERTSKVEKREEEKRSDAHFAVRFL
jgi:hypothetical protein